MEDGREHFTGDLVHIRDHQEQALAGGVGGGESTCAQAAVDGTGGTGFGLHFDDLHRFAEHVLHVAACPFIGVFTHR